MTARSSGYAHHRVDLEPGTPVTSYTGPPMAHLRRLPHGEGFLLWLPYAKNPTPMNRSGAHGNWRAEFAAARNVRATAEMLTRGKFTAPRIRVRLDWEVTTRRTRDEDNLVKCMKHLVDGLVTAHVVPDDSRRYVERLMPEINFAPASDSREAHMRLWIWPLPA